MTDMTQLEQILLSSWKMFLEKKTADWELCSNGLVQSFCKFKVPNIHNLASTLWLWWRSLWSNGIEKRGHSTNRFSPSTTHFFFIFHPEHIPIHLFFYFQTENVERKDMRERDNSNTPEVVWELFCKMWDFILHNDLENDQWVIGYGTRLEFILHTMRGARIYFARG